MNGGARSVDDTLVNLALIAIAGLGVLAAALRFAGTVAAWVVGVAQPNVGWSAGFSVLAAPGDPGRALGAEISVWAYWTVLVLMLAVGSTCAIVVWRRIAALRQTSQHDPRRLIGTATRHDVVSTASKKALLRRSSTLRASLDHAVPGDVGYLLGDLEAWRSGPRLRTRSWCSAHPVPARACTS